MTTRDAAAKVPDEVSGAAALRVSDAFAYAAAGRVSSGRLLLLELQNEALGCQEDWAPQLVAFTECMQQLFDERFPPPP